VLGPTSHAYPLKLAELPELIFTSIYICIINLNINLDRPKNWLEYNIRVFIYAVLVLIALHWE